MLLGEEGWRDGGMEGGRRWIIRIRLLSVLTRGGNMEAGGLLVCVRDYSEIFLRVFVCM